MRFGAFTARGAAASGGAGNTPPSQGDLVPSRLSGVAPLYVFFETAFDAGDDAFGTRIVDWDFGETTVSAWSTTGGDKNLHTGPIAAHVFEEPGSYVVTATTLDGEGNEISQSATIVVEDGDTVFSGTSTICISQTGDFTGAPAGSLEVQTSDIATVSGYIQPGNRILFRRGETWAMGQSIGINVAGPGHVGAFGVGADPIFSTSGSAFSLSGSTPIANDWRITDLQITGVGEDVNAVQLGGQTNNLLLQRLTMRNVHTGVSAADSVLNYWNSQGEGPHDLHDGVGLVELDVRQINGGLGGNGVYFTGRRIAALGCHFEDSTAGEHIWRMPHIEKGVLSHNVISEASSPRHLLKLHGPDFTGVGAVAAGRYTELVQISDNIFLGSNEDWPVAIGPKNGTTDERVRNIVLERNYFVAAATNQVMAIFWARSVTARNNVFDVSNAAEGVYCFNASQRGIEPAPDNIRLYHNTGYSSLGGTVNLMDISGASASSASNNLVVSEGGTAQLGNAGANTESNNILSSASIFGASPTPPAGLVPSIGSAADNAGTPILVSGLNKDYLGTVRSGSTPDAGAIEN